ncbi:unnamed protein product [Rotaria sp. Silwood2]|nr:unnamed protein product [Rotaria sp. Silwood2]CAF3315448.1 unnamed protein product [Rotaria sp. Silwood2]CAF4429356.1 unnamed protein product [Rotaria sp. Silwood2]CAF4451392.1 unnamed protein product [Rotaria sp. Silwood2]
MFVFERDIVKQVNNSGGLYLRYIDDIFIIINWPMRHFMKQVDRWNKFDENIRLLADVSLHADFLDLHMENQDGKLFTTVYHKPSYEPYYLPFNNEHGKLRMALLLNKYPGELINQQFNHVLPKLNINRPLTINNYNTLRQKLIYTPIQEKQLVDHGKTIFVHFTYCSSMRTFPAKFHALWQKYFLESPMSEIIPVLGTRNVDNLQRRLVDTRQL